MAKDGSTVPKNHNHAKKKVLVIDDDSDFLESLQLLLMMDGHDVLPVTDGNDAVERYMEFEPDVVLLDIRMPNIDGYCVFERIKRHIPDARVYFTSGYALSEEKYKNAVSLSLSGLLPKPIDPAALKKILQEPVNPD